MTDFDIQEWKMRDGDIDSIEATSSTVEFHFDPKDLGDDYIFVDREDVINLAKHFDIKRSEIDEL